MSQVQNDSVASCSMLVEGSLFLTALSCVSTGIAVTRLRTGTPRNRVSIFGSGERIFSSSKMSGPVLGPTQRPLQWLPGVKQPVVQLDTHCHLVPRLRMRGALRVFPLMHFDAHENSHALPLYSAVYWPLHSACQTHTHVLFR